MPMRPVEMRGGDLLRRAAILLRWHQPKEERARDDGTYIVGVLTTGIYCLPSCTARKPKDENVRFFIDEKGARGAGLRACKRCRPDHFYRRYDPDRESVARLARHVRSNPAEFAGAGDLRAYAGLGATKLGTLFRRHYHESPVAYLLRARLAAAARDLIRGDERVVDVALGVGFESVSAFHESFLSSYCLSPGAYRKLGASDAFRLKLPTNFRTDDVFGLFGRDVDGCTERVDGDRATKALHLSGRPVRLELLFSVTGAQPSVRVRVVARRKMPGSSRRAVAVEAHARVVRMLGLASDPGPFERRMGRTRGLGRLIRGRRGLRIPLTNDAFEGLVWVIVGQQINLAFASLCRSRLIALCGSDAGGGFRAHPGAEDVARLDVADLMPLQFSRRKAEYLIDTSREIAEGRLDLEGLGAEPAGYIEETLDAVRGLGPWSIQYLLMRAYGLGDCVPVGDSGLVAALQRFFDLDERPDVRRTLELMKPFAPQRSLGTFHLWKSN